MNLPSSETITFYGNLLLKLGILHWRKQDYEKAYDHVQIALDIARIIQDNDFGAECLYAIALVDPALEEKRKQSMHMKLQLISLLTRNYPGTL